MMNNPVFKNSFVEYIPSDLKQNVLYISMENSICIHLCACGCGEKVVTRLSPNDWDLYYDGKHITMYPSIGNWNFNCRSHYWIRDNRFVFIPDIKKKKKKPWFIFW
ncbi:DUF6527 family protein [Faecalibacter bovis]|uniref:Uncharacterized protein n=1 Tax=Faecalibacter bovis TaxID=2898187 RepID=A0ABX7XFW5_9FLAO|nr:DUF6527 family protein [Faecalibacter bovis]QTV06742.1 hypothetical protein J9309_05355 [Faecalibacter bovis]